MHKHLMKLFLGASVLLLASACGQTGTDHDAEANTEAALDYNAIADAAVSDPNRWPDDAENDERRKPVETLAFMKVAPGMSVFEVEAGGGYFTELFSGAVGAEGSVVMQNPEGILVFVGEEIEARLADNRLTNVRDSLSLFDDLDAEDGSMDLATWVLGPHELYFIQEDGSNLGDPEASFAEIFRIVKPGGSFVAIDHSTVDGASEDVSTALHRIDKARVINMAEAAGFTMEGESDVLANPDDDRTIMVFNPDVRGKTDQFAVRFSKPE